MSDSNLPYGAVPPPSFPPPPPPPAAGGAGSGKGVWIALAVIGVLALVGVIVGLILLLTNSDEDQGSDRAGNDTSTTATSDDAESDGGESGDPTDDTATDGPTSSLPPPPPPTPPSTSGSASPSVPPGGGTSTADAVPNEPKAVVEAFLGALLEGDCATAEDLVTDAYKRAEGDCDSSVSTDGTDGFKYTVGKATIDRAAGTATVPVTATAAGQTDSTTVDLVNVAGKWRINQFD